MGKFFQIGEVCQATGLTPRTLHYYDEIGLLVPSERLAGGQRLYIAADLERIDRIKELKRLLGLSLSEIKRLLDADDARTRHLAAAQKATDEPARRAALEQALGVTEAQWRSVQEKIEQLAQFGRKLERHVRDLRRLLKSSRGGGEVSPNGNRAPRGGRPSKAASAMPADPGPAARAKSAPAMMKLKQTAGGER